MDLINSLIGHVAAELKRSIGSNLSDLDFYAQVSRAFESWTPKNCFVFNTMVKGSSTTETTKLDPITREIIRIQAEERFLCTHCVDRPCMSWPTAFSIDNRGKRCPFRRYNNRKFLRLSAVDRRWHERAGR